MTSSLQVMILWNLFSKVILAYWVKVKRKKKTIFLSHKKYVLDLFLEYGKIGVNSCSIPMTPNMHIEKEDADSFEDSES